MSERALVARINRALDKQGETLRRCRDDSRFYTTLGRYYVLDVSGNYVARHDVGLEETARALEVLAPYEALETD